MIFRGASSKVAWRSQGDREERAMAGRQARMGPRAFGGVSELLAQACSRERPDRREIRRLLESGSCPNGQSESGESPLMMLCERAAEGAEGCVKELLLAGARADLRDAQGESALLKACRAGAVGLARELLAAGANPNGRSRAGASPLAAAFAEGAEELGWALLGAGAAADDAAEDGRPLLVAAAGLPGAAGWTQALLFHGARLELADRAGWTPLAMAAWAGARGPLRALLEAGANPRAEGPMGKRPLDIALGARAPEAPMGRSRVAPAHIDCAELILAFCPGARALDSLGLPPLIRLWRSTGRFERDWMDRLSAAGADPLSLDDEGQGLLHWASEGSEEAGLALARWALERGAPPAERSSRGEAPWERASRRGRASLARLLLSEHEKRELDEGAQSAGRSGARFL